jgi:hypothetical protein
MNASTSPAHAVPALDLLQRYIRLRWRTESLIESLGPEDMVVQSMADTSPAKWHLAHTTWFFETFFAGCTRAGLPGI